MSDATKSVTTNADALQPDAASLRKAQTEVRISELARLEPIEYEQRRETEAKELVMRVSVLDKLVSAQRPTIREEDAVDPFDAVDEWDEPVDGAILLTEINATILRFCILPDHSSLLMSAWILHAWTHNTADISPVMAFVSPEKRCGKTTALSVVSSLVPRPMNTINISASVLFRVVEKYAPTVLIDEGDMFLAADKNNDMLGMLNGGHNKLIAYVWRSVGDDHEPRRFKVWAPKVIAMIGKLPDTLEDRSLVIHLRRKRPGEQVDRFRADRAHELLHLRRKAARWAADNVVLLQGADPEVPEVLNDRAQDNARAICAIADIAGGSWSAAIRAALIASSAQSEDEPQSAGVLLLRDVAAIFELQGKNQVSSTSLCDSLCALEASPWAEWRGGRPISTRGVAQLLKAFGIVPRRGRTNNSYVVQDFADAIARYLPQGIETASTTSTSSTPISSSNEKQNKYNVDGGNGTCGPFSEGGGNKIHSDTVERGTR